MRPGSSCPSVQVTPEEVSDFSAANVKLYDFHELLEKVCLRDISSLSLVVSAVESMST